MKSNELEIKLLLEAIYQYHGYDFRNYNLAHIRRRIKRRVEMMGLDSVSMLQHYVLHDESVFTDLLFDLSIKVTEMFRDPGFYVALKKKVFPHLKDELPAKIWHAGCASGEEVYSMAIALKEDEMLKDCRIYATDFNPVALQESKEGIYDISKIKNYTFNYQKAEGKSSFSNYYTAQYDKAIMQKDLKRNMIFAEHNLVTDRDFGEMQLIICRNVLIYFNQELQNKVLKLFYDSLPQGGYLGLGSKESIEFSSMADYFIPVDAKQKIYQKK